MSNGKLDNFNINTIPKLIESDYTETYINYLTGGLIGGSITYGLVLLFSPKIIILATASKLITTIFGISAGSYLLDTNSLNHYQKMTEIKDLSKIKSKQFITNINNSDYMYLYDNITTILTNKDHPIGEVNYKYINLYKQYDKPLVVLKFHLYQVKNLIQYVYDLDKYSEKLKNYILTCIERCICNLTYNYIINIICNMNQDYNKQFRINKNDSKIHNEMKKDITKYNLNFNVLIEMINNINNCKSSYDKISCLDTLTKQINKELANQGQQMASDNLLDVLTYIILNSSIYNPYDEIQYIDEYLQNNNDKYAYLLTSFNAAVNYIKNYNQ